MRLIKSKDIIFSPKKNRWWNKSYAQVPIVDFNNDHWDIYYSSRDEKGKSQISYISVEPGNPENILYEHPDPILSLGKIGTFDESGIMPTSIVSLNGMKYLYYIGWSERSSVPFSNSIGLSISVKGNTFDKFEGPIVSQSIYEPYFTGTAYVLKDSKNWKMWYLSCTGWNGFEPNYNIKLATSFDGINWKYPVSTAINFKNSNEVAICSSSVLKDKGYKMWYCYRGANGYREGSKDSYKIGYAESRDGYNWNRKDDEIKSNVEKWDYKMMGYPNVVKYQGELFMFYNGNDFGKEGFGYARIIN